MNRARMQVFLVMLTIITFCAASDALAFKKLEGSEMPLLTGDAWQNMSQDSKVSFVWGMGHIVEIERHLMNKYPELQRDSFVTKMVEALGGVSMNDLVNDIDAYYKANPDKLDVPVIRVVWDALVRPNIKTGIAGRPLSVEPVAPVEKK